MDWKSSLKLSLILLILQTHVYPFPITLQTLFPLCFCSLVDESWESCWWLWLYPLQQHGKPGQRIDVDAIVILMALLLWRRMWWNWLHCTLFSSVVHCCLWVQFATLWSHPAFFKQLKHTWFSWAFFSRSSILRAADLGDWSGQWVELLHSQHLWLVCFVSSPSCTWRWLTLHRLFELDLKEAVACMRNFVSTDIHSMRSFSEADFPSCSRSLDHTFLSSAHIFCSIIDNIWLLSISWGTPTSLSAL